MVTASTPKKSASPTAARKKALASKQTAAAAKPGPGAKSVSGTAKKTQSASTVPAKKTSAPAAKVSASPQVKAKPAAELNKMKAAAESKNKIKKPKIIRDSFTMPEDEYQVLGDVKKACIKAGFEVKKSELLRVGVALIQKMEITTLKDVLATLPPLKAGRPKKNK